MVRPVPDRSAPRVVGLAGGLIMVIMVATSCSSDASTGSAAVTVPTTHPTVDPVTAGSTSTPAAARPGAGGAGSGAAGTTVPATIPGAKSGDTASRRRHPAGATGSTDTTRPLHQVRGGTTGIPPLQQQFAADDAAFESVLKSVQGSLNRLPSTAGADEVSQAVLPLVAAADQYQSEIVNLPWPGAAKPLAQSLTESLGQLTAVLAGVGRPLVFPSVRAFLSQLSSAAQAVRMAAGAARGHVARS